ncbi:MAG: excinuclease ABC subunit A, partial [Gammaproteobacteria bacterium]
LVNTLFVLDEPSIGLHARDMGRVIGVLERLRDAGNTLVVVEHDSQVMRAADTLLDLGPGPGARGGEVVYFGPPSGIAKARRSLTGRYLSGELAVNPARKKPNPIDGDTPYLEILGASEHNLRDVDARIPLNRLVCITGVSGSGKSTLIQDVAFNALAKLKGHPGEGAGAHRAIRGHGQIDDVVLVDQSPIGKTTRSNPASYVGALTAIRKAFAKEPLARERRYTPGTFSFNSGNGRCPACGGNGFEHVEMQFLSDVYLRCPDCDGRRFRPETLEVKLWPESGQGSGRSIADVLEMTVAEALDFFGHDDEVQSLLAPLAKVGLDYMQLGQPVPTLSGGEAQRLKLAGHLAKAGSKRRGDGQHLLLMLDEPTTGLHFDDIKRLMGALRELLDRGQSVVVIEHNLDVIAAADWIIDLGPEGGDGGGEIVCEGTPADVKACKASHTGRALRTAGRRTTRSKRPTHRRSKRKAAVHGNGTSIDIRNAREHNLKGVDIHIPREQFTVISGISGSGKSTVAFDILFAEGQRRYLESLNAYARQFVQPAARPEVDAIFGIPPAVAIEQRTSRGGRKSTVATLTEIYHFLRLLYVRLGTQHCPDCDLAIEPQTAQAVLASILRSYRNRNVAVLAPLVVARKGYYTDLADWASNKGYATLRVDGESLPTDDWPRLDRYQEHDIDLPVGELRITASKEGALRELLSRALDFGKGRVRVAAVGRGAQRETLFSTERACPGCGRSFDEL